MNFKVCCIMNLILFIMLLMTGCGCCLDHIFKKPNPKGIPKMSAINSVAGETRSVYYHEQTMAIVDFSAWKQIIRCEVIDVDQIKNPSLFNYKIQVGFDYMLGIMEQCDKLDFDYNYSSTKRRIVRGFLRRLPSIVAHAPSNLLHAIYPGTKWCGMGDIAKSYHDLGKERDLDRCCRSHDLCPVSVEGKTRRYNIQNNSSITRSHCTCDTLFYNCLKNDNTLASKNVGLQYFNVLHLECVDDDLAHQTKRLRKFPIGRF